MKAKPETKTVEQLLQLKMANMLYANPEYQRGDVWTLAQKKRLIDSVFRGYPIPLIYLHHISKELAGAKREDFEVIDGQQRINSLYEYREGSFKTFDPVKDEEEARFPSFIKDTACPWGGKRFEDLAPDLQEKILFLKWEAAEHCGICEQTIRRMSSLLLWTDQRARWAALTSRICDRA